MAARLPARASRLVESWCGIILFKQFVVSIISLDNYINVLYFHTLYVTSIFAQTIYRIYLGAVYRFMGWGGRSNK